MSHDRGTRAPWWLARYVRQWWPDAQPVGSGRRGVDLENTPPVAFECKTADEFRPLEFVRQAERQAGTGQLPVVIYWPRKVGEEGTRNTLAILPLWRLMDVLEEAGYTPNRDHASEWYAEHPGPVVRSMTRRQMGPI